MNYRFVSASLALACRVVIGASVPAQAGDWGRPGHHHNGPPLSYWGWKRAHLHHHHGHWGRAVPRPYAAYPMRPLPSCSMRSGSGQQNNGSAGGGIISLRLVTPQRLTEP